MTTAAAAVPAGAIRVGILDDFLNVTRTVADWGRLPPRVSVTVFNDRVDADDLIARLLPFEVVVATRERTAFPRHVVERLPNLRLLVTTGRRNLGIDLAACRDKGIVVCGTNSGMAATAELTWALILAAARHIVDEDRALRAGRWQTALGTTLNGRTLAVLGLGRIGSQVARFGLAFGMTVVAWSANLTDERAAEAGCRRVSRAELFERADVLSIHLVLSERTRGIVGRCELALMKPGAILVNTSRAAIVDETALIAALKNGTIGGAALDVHAGEPLPQDAPIRLAPHTILTPHLGYVTRETYDVYFPQALENVEAWLAGTPIRVIAEQDPGGR